MKTLFYAILVTSMTISFAQAAGMAIPQNSESEWDFREKVSVFFHGSESAKKLPECKTYEELRDTLEKAIPELIQSKY